jgi:hypothetical protein
MKIQSALLTVYFLSNIVPVSANVSNTSTNPTEQTMPTSGNQNMKKEKLPESSTTDSYESPTIGSGDLSTAGEASTSPNHETAPLYQKKKSKKHEKTSKLGACDTATDKSLCEKTNQMNQSMRERPGEPAASQRGGKQADRDIE